ncbi:MAG: glutathione S-transferase [Pelagibacterium sp. SCN 63-23]|nr:MAG: glutathione S-transferase [Pelagibacterium sp. SCN 63-23]
MTDIPTITAFERSPDGGRGLARDMRVRWALEEVGQTYEVRPVSFAAMKQAAYRMRQPFGQIPSYEEGALILFESGAIVLHIAEHHQGLLPRDGHARARAIAWLFAALSTIEPPIIEREQVPYAERDKPWYSEDRLRFLDDRISDRLRDLSAWLGDRNWLDGAFSVGDLMMVMVLRRLERTGIVAAFPNLAGFVARGEARPAYQRAFAAQEAFHRAAATAG